jgi:DNA topoisomerase-1
LTAKKKEAKAKKEKGKRTKAPKGELIIVESPTKIRTLKKFLDKKFKVIATKGHILDLPKSKLGVDLENGFAPHYSVIHGKGQVLKDLVKEAKSKVKIYLAPDPDREGEAIAYHLLLKLDKAPGTIKRVTFNEITRTAVFKGLEEATEIDMQKVHAQQARRVLDRLVGYQVSPILWQTMYSGLSAGRVQSVALRIICEREAEITAFVPTEYWSIHSDFSTDDDSRFTAKLFRIDGNEVTISSGDEAGGIVDEIKRQQFNVTDVRKDERKRQPLPPYITSTLQQDASRQVGFSTQKTMIVAQQLYEGIELGSEGPVGLITYMRTDSVRTAEEAITAARQSIDTRFGKSYLPDAPRRFRTRKRAQDAHEAIRPTDLENQPSKLRKYLSTEQFKLYSLIYNRFLASQMNEAVYNQIRVDVTGGRFVFRAVDTKLVFDGFLKVYEEARSENGDKKNGDTILPDLTESQRLTLVEVTPNQHFTKPPPRFSEASLVKELEANGIGRPSTYSQIINTLKARKYVELDKRRLSPTELGTIVSDLLVKHFEKVFNVEFTAAMEDELDKIEEGSDHWQKVLTDFYGPFSQNLEEVKGKIDEIKSETQKVSDELCDKCGASMIVKWGRNGQFLACSAYPECKSTRPLDNEGNGEPVERDCPKCGEPLIYRQGRFGKFIACSSYPDCKYTESITTGVKCPREGCEGELSERRTSRGKLFWGCTKYPECKFATWYKPVARKCPACGLPVLVEKETKRLGQHLACPECKQVVKLTEEEPVTELEDARK